MTKARYRLGDWTISPADNSLCRDGDEPVQIPPKQFEVLLLLLAAENGLQSRQFLIERVWPGNAAVGERGITNVVYQLRKLLARDEGDEVIRTLPKVGYQLVTPVERLDPLNPPDPGTKTLSRHNGLWFATVLGLVTMMGLMLWQGPGDTTTAQERSAPVRYGKPVPLTYLEGVEEHPAISPDGRFLAFTWQKPERPSRIFIKDLQDAGAPLRQISFSDADETNPAWSPRGDKLAFLRLTDNGQCDVWMKDVDGLQEYRLTTCVQRRFHQALHWSASGRYLAVIDRVPQTEHSAVYLFDLLTNERRQLTQPVQGSSDSQVTWGHRSDRLLVVRQQNKLAQLLLVELDGTSRALTGFDAPIHGQAWSHDDSYVVFNAMRDGDHALWRLDLEGGLPVALHRDLTPFNVVALPGKDQFAYSRHASQEYLQWRAGGVNSRLDSAGRDLYGTLSPDGRYMAFMSNRSGQFEVWLAEKGEAPKMLTRREGLTDIPAWSPDSKQLLLPLGGQNNSGTRMLLYDVVTGDRNLLWQDAHQYRNPQWSPDGRSVIVASNRSGRWQLWERFLGSGRWEQLTEQGGLFGRRMADGRLVFTRPSQPGLWYKMPGQDSRLVMKELAADDWGNWLLMEDGVLYLRRSSERDELVLWQRDRHRVLAEYPHSSIKIHRSLSGHSLDNLVLTRLNQREANILAITPVRL